MTMRHNETERKLVWTEANLQALLVGNFFTKFGCRNSGFCPNLHYGDNWEADLILVHRSGFVTEYEIKLTRADFLADQKYKTAKHAALAAARGCKNRKERPPFELPNYLVYVCPASLDLLPGEVPEYAGLMVVTDAGRLQIVKRAPVIHTHKFEAFNNLTTPLSWRLAKGMQVQYEDEQTDAIPTI